MSEGNTCKSLNTFKVAFTFTGKNGAYIAVSRRLGVAAHAAPHADERIRVIDRDTPQ